MWKKEHSTPLVCESHGNLMVHMNAKKKLLLWILTPLLISAIAYSLWLPGILEYEASKRDGQPSGISIPNAILGYFVFLSLLAFESGPIGLVVFGLLGSVWVRYFVKFCADCLKERQRSRTNMHA